MTDDAAIMQKLARIQGRGTAYEVVITKGDTTYLVSYVARHSYAGMRDAVVQRAEEIVVKTNAAHIDKAGRTITTDNGWTIKFSGRTQRDAICNGEHTYVGD